MISILVPSEEIALTGEIQQALLVAQQQGLMIENIELGVSPTQYLLIKTGQGEQVFGCDLWASDDRCCDVYLRYLNDEMPSSVAKQHVLVGVKQSEAWLDVWTHPITTERRALSYEQSVRDSNSEHLAWLIALMSMDFPIEDALTLARAKMNVSRETWPDTFELFPTPVLQNQRLGISVAWSNQNDNAAFDELLPASLGLYPVVDCAEWVERLLKLGIKTVQLRIKDSRSADLEQQIKHAIELGEQYQAQVFINDYWQLAIKHSAFGVHLGQEDLEVSNIAQLRQAGLCLGLSTHGYYELLRIVQLKPSYIALGHIFPTTTKQMPSKPQGLVRLSLYQRLINTMPYGFKAQIRGYPTVAIGGIDLSNATKVWQCGVTSLAVVRAITLATDPQKVIEQFSEIMQADHKQVVEVVDAI